MLRWLLFVGRVVLGGVLIYAGYTKLELPWITFAAQIESYKVITGEPVIWVAKTLPWFEVVLGAALLLGIGVRWFAGLASALLLFFFVLVVRSYALGLDIDCGCFGPGDKLTWKTMVRDGALVTMSFLLTWGAFRQARKAKTKSPQPSTVEQVSGA